ncbi:MAG: hypothetical protein WA639_25755, partial [Candidatus Acidiferrum sp.]
LGYAAHGTKNAVRICPTPLPMLLCRPDNLLNATEMRHAKFLAGVVKCLKTKGKCDIINKGSLLRVDNIRGSGARVIFA